MAFGELGTFWPPTMDAYLTTLAEILAATLSLSKSPTLYGLSPSVYHNADYLLWFPGVYTDRELPSR